jgi:hypothetical protein
MSINRAPKLDYTIKYQIQSGRVNFANYAQKKQLVQEGRLLGLNLYPPDNDASIISLIKEGELNTTPEELAGYLEEIVLPPTSTTPDAPTGLIGVAGNAQATISFTPGFSGGSAITNYQYSTDDGVTFTAFSPAVTSSPVTITGLTNGVSYTIKLKAVNANGAGAVSAGISVIPLIPMGTALWATRFGGLSIDSTPSITTDLNGNVYASGQYQSAPLTLNNYNNISGGVVYVSTFGTLSNAGSTDIFLAKYNSSGLAQWTTRIGGMSSESIPSIASDSNGNVYVSGDYQSAPLTINNYSNVSGGVVYVSTFGTLSNAGIADIFLAKYNASGLAQWTTSIGGTITDNNTYIATDLYGNVYVSGQYSSAPLTINNYSNVSGGVVYISTFGTLSNAGSIDIFLAKYNSSGLAQWTTRIGGTSAESSAYITTDLYGNVYIAGQYSSAPLTINSYSNVSGGVVYVSTFGTLSNAGSTDIFLAKYNSSGLAQWATQLGGLSIDSIPSIATDLYENVYIAGQYSSAPLTINNYSNVSGGVVYLSTFGTLSNAGGADIFLAKYNSSGFAQWTTRIGGTNFEQTPSITTDSNGNVYVSGHYQSAPLTLNNYSNVSGGVVYVSTFGTLSNAGSIDIFLAKYNSSGLAQWTTRIGGTSTESDSSIATDLYGNVYVSGQYNSAPLTINNYSNVSGGVVYVSTFGTLSNAGSTNIFLAKYSA